jgi:hypothetical protein
MKTFEARVVKGRLVIDAPSPYPDGTVIRLVVAAEQPAVDLDMDAEERAALRASLKRGKADAKAGRVTPAEKVIAELRAKK